MSFFLLTFRIESSGHGSCGSDNENNRDTTSKEEIEGNAVNLKLCKNKEDIQVSNPLPHQFSKFERLSKLLENLNKTIDAVTQNFEWFKEFPELQADFIKIQKKTEDIIVTRIVEKTFFKPLINIFHDSRQFCFMGSTTATQVLS